MNHEYMVVYATNDNPYCAIKGRIVVHAQTINQATEDADSVLSRMHPDNYTIISITQED